MSKVTPDDPRYPTLVRGFNLRWVGTPSYVQVCSETQEVVDAVQLAVDSGLRVTVQSGGHCYENFAVGNTGGVIIDMAGFNQVYYDDEMQAFCIEAGCTLWNVYWNLYKEYGVCIPGGSCYSVGAGGHISGGGYGLLSRKFGLTVDWLYGVEMVVVDAAGGAEAVVVTDSSTDPEDQNLLWGCQGGGGGNFGIITRFFFRELPSAPPFAYVQNLAWNWSETSQNQFTTLVQRYGAFLQQNSAPDSPYDGLFTLLHLTQQAASQFTLTAQYAGDRHELLDEFVNYMNGDGRAGRIVAQTHAVGRHFFPLRTTRKTPMPWLYATQTLDGSGPNQRGKYKSAYMTQPFPDSQIQTIYNWLTDSCYANSQALLQVDSYGCSINRIAPDATAVPQRSSIMKLQYQTYWTDPKDDALNLDWIRGFYNEMYGPDGPMPDGTMDGCYVNYPDSDLQNWAYLYYLGNYPRLQQVKKTWDPNNIFNHAQSIQLP
ncbi:MAG TPA: FAD-binding protein [Thermoanaerobaculia bacterium]|nr:FAD-binding protein [Thermoanaerobaculia bacterium]